MNHFGNMICLFLPVFVKEADDDPDDEQSHGAQLAHLEGPRDVWQVVWEREKQIARMTDKVFLCRSFPLSHRGAGPGAAGTAPCRAPCRAR